MFEQSIHIPLSFSGICGFSGNFRFQIREWCAMQFRKTAIHLIQLSKYKCCGRLNSRAITFFTCLSPKFSNNLESVPKDTTSKVFHTGGNWGDVYFAKCSLMKSSLDLFSSLPIWDKFSLNNVDYQINARS